MIIWTKHQVSSIYDKDFCWIRWNQIHALDSELTTDLYSQNVVQNELASVKKTKVRLWRPPPLPIPNPWILNY